MEQTTKFWFSVSLHLALFALILKPIGVVGASVPNTSATDALGILSAIVFFVAVLYELLEPVSNES